MSGNKKNEKSNVKDGSASNKNKEVLEKSSISVAGPVSVPSVTKPLKSALSTKKRGKAGNNKVSFDSLLVWQEFLKEKQNKTTEKTLGNAGKLSEEFVEFSIRSKLYGDVGNSVFLGEKQKKSILQDIRNLFMPTLVSVSSKDKKYFTEEFDKLEAQNKDELENIKIRFYQTEIKNFNKHFCEFLGTSSVEEKRSTSDMLVRLEQFSEAKLLHPKVLYHLAEAMKFWVLSEPEEGPVDFNRLREFLGPVYIEFKQEIDWAIRTLNNKVDQQKTDQDKDADTKNNLDKSGQGTLKNKP